MTEHVIATLDSVTGRVVVDAELPSATGVNDALSGLLGASAGTSVGCARPSVVRAFPTEPQPPLMQRIRVSGYWHDDHMVGPGRRSVLRMQGCPIRCVGCWVPETWSERGGQTISIDSAVGALLAHDFGRDGVTILGGEPFAQPFALARLVSALRTAQPDIHIVVYTGYTLERLRARAAEDKGLGESWSIGVVLDSIDILIDGPYIAARADSAGPWTGSGNQRVHYLR